MRIGVVGLGQISELVVPSYLGRDDVEIVALCDRDESKVARWRTVFPHASGTTDLDELLRVDADVVDVLVPTPAHGDVASRVLDAGFHLQVQKPLARNLDDAIASSPPRLAPGASVRVMEDYLFYPPLVQLRDVITSGEIGEPAGVHMKIVANGLGGWEVPASAYEWQFEQALDGRGMMVFDHGWHQLAVACWLFGPVRRIFGWVGATEIVPGIVLDAPSTLVWEHHNGVRAVLDITFAPTCSSAPTTTRATSASRSLDAKGSCAAIASVPAACKSHRSSSTATARCAATTPSTTGLLMRSPARPTTGWRGSRGRPTRS